jgi:hypothetical protein
LSKNSSPLISHEGGLDAPFGKRLYDQTVITRLKSVTKFKFWGSCLLLAVITVLLEIATSNRVLKMTAQPVEFDSKDRKIRVDGENIVVPALVLEFQRAIAIPEWAKVKAAPIKILSFVNSSEIPPGAEAKAMLLTGATNGLIKAKLTEPVKIDGVSFLDAGVILLGQGHSTEERLYVDFRKAVFRDGKSISISAQAYDSSDTILGLKGSRVGDLGLKLAASSGLNFLSGMAVGLQTPAYDQSGRPLKPSVGDAALNGVSKAAGDQAKSYMEEIKNRPPIIEVKIGSIFIVTFDGGNQ